MQDVFHFEFDSWDGMAPDCDIRGCGAGATVRVGHKFYCRDCYCQLASLERREQRLATRGSLAVMRDRLVECSGWVGMLIALGGCVWLGVRAGISLGAWLFGGTN